MKLDNPKGAHYAGGDIAAPVTQVVLRAALAARDAALDRRDLAASEKTTQPEHDVAAHTSSGTPAKLARRDVERPGRPSSDSYDPHGNVGSRGTSEEPASYVVELPASAKSAATAISPRPVPDVRGLSVRDAVRALHTAGFRVRLLNASAPGTLPAAGAIAPPGTIVQLSRPIE